MLPTEHMKKHAVVHALEAYTACICMCFVFNTFFKKRKVKWQLTFDLYIQLENVELSRYATSEQTHSHSFARKFSQKLYMNLFWIPEHECLTCSIT